MSLVKEFVPAGVSTESETPLVPLEDHVRDYLSFTQLMEQILKKLTVGEARIQVTIDLQPCLNKHRSVVYRATVRILPLDDEVVLETSKGEKSLPRQGFVVTFTVAPESLRLEQGDERKDIFFNDLISLTCDELGMRIRA